MASGRGIRAGKAYVEINADDKGFAAGLARAGARLRHFASTVASASKAAGTAILSLNAPAVAATLVYAKMGSALADMSARTGASAEALSKLAYAAQMTGATSEDVEKGMRKLAQTTADAAAGSDTAKDALAKFGLTAERLVGLSPDKQIALLADGMKRLEGTERTAAVLDVLGRGGTALIPALSGGAAGLEEMAKRAESLGLVIGGKATESADKFGDALDEMWGQVKMVTFHLGAALGEAILPWVPAVQAALKAVIDFVKENKGLIVTVATVGVVLAVAGVMFAGLVATVFGVGVALSALATLFSVAGAAVGVLLSPVGLVVAAVVGLGVAIVTMTSQGKAAFASFSGGVGQALNYVGSVLGELLAWGKDVFGAIGAALQAGDLKAAMGVLMAAWNVAWATGVKFLSEVWRDWGVGVVSTVHGLYTEVLKVWDWMTSGIEMGIHYAMTYVVGLFDRGFSAIGGTLDWFYTKFMNIWTDSYQLVGSVIAQVTKLFNSSYDAAGEIARLSKEAEEAKAKRNEAMQQRAGERDAATVNRALGRDEVLEASLKEAQRQYEQKQKELEESKAMFAKGLSGDAEKRVAEATTMLEKYNKELEEAKKVARDAEKNKNSFGGFAKPDAMVDLEEGLRAAEDVANKGRTTGTFTAAVAQQLLGADNASVETNTKKTAENTAALNAKIQKLIEMSTAGQGTALFS